MGRRKAALAALSTLKEQEGLNLVWMNERPLYEKRLAWLEANMPYTASAGRSRGELLDDLQGSARDVGLKVDNENPQESFALDHANEVSVSMRVRGDQETMIRWLLTLQAPDRFTVIKSIEMELDSRSKEKTPQVQCNITVARWFNPNPPAGGVPVEPAPVPVTAPAQDIPNPLEIGSPLDSLIPNQSS
jgi:hypothetical protein